MGTNVVILHEAMHPEHPVGGWRLCLHWARYQYDNGNDPECGYRFMWRREDGTLQAARGQARIPSRADADLLFKMADDAGWGQHES
jgi:hypothetical protein